jgi:hypothetical protein
LGIALFRNTRTFNIQTLVSYTRMHVSVFS